MQQGKSARGKWFRWDRGGGGGERYRDKRQNGYLPVLPIVRALYSNGSVCIFKLAGSMGKQKWRRSTGPAMIRRCGLDKNVDFQRSSEWTRKHRTRAMCDNRVRRPMGNALKLVLSPSGYGRINEYVYF